MQDILAGLLDDKPTPEPTPTKEVQESSQLDRVMEAHDAGMIDTATAISQALNSQREEAEANDDPLAALASIMEEGESLSPPPPTPQEQMETAAAAVEAGLMSDEEGFAQAVAALAAKPQVHVPTFTTDEIADAIDIRNFGTLVTLQTRRWHAKVKDRQASRDAAAASNADAAAFETHKKLLAGADEKLKRIHKAIDDARAKHYRMTLPWSTVSHDDSSKRTGARLLPNTLFMEYTTTMAHALQEMKQAINDFVPAYPALIQLAQQKLGMRFNAAEYPNASAIANYFDLSFDFMPIPLGGDFQGLADAQVQRLADTLQRKTRQMLENAMQDAWLRLHETVSHAAERLTNPDATFHYTMVEKLKEQADLLKHLNVTNDQRIEDVRLYVEKHLTMYDVKDIRKDENLRKQMAKDARTALEAMEAAK
jgi:hypothetical protein